MRLEALQQINYSKSNYQIPSTYQARFTAPEHEEVIIGHVLAGHGTSSIKEISSDFHANWFCIDQNRIKWNAFLAIEKEGRNANNLNVSEHLLNKGLLEQAGGPSSIIPENLIPDVLKDSVFRVRECFLKREKSHIGKLIQEGLETSEDIQRLETLDAKLAGSDKLIDVFSKATVSFPELVKLEIPPRRKIVGDWLCEADYGIVFAPRGVGKTWISLGLATAISGKESFGPWKIEDRPKILYIDGEMPVELIRQRAEGMGGGDDGLLILNHQLLFNQTQQEMNLALSDQQRAITQLCLREGVQLLILDNLSCLVYGIEENKNYAWEPMKQWFLMCRRHGIAVILVHHAGRNGELRGGSKREDDTSWIISLEEAGDESSSKQGASFISRFTKPPRNVPKGEPSIAWSFTTGEDGVVSITTNEPDKLEILLQWVRDGLTSTTDIAREMKVGTGTISKWATKLIGEGLLKKNGREYALP
jgi:hypothetical protein